MSGWIGVVGGVVAALLGSLAYRGFRCRVHGRKFALSGGDDGDTLQTELGRLRVDRAGAKIHIEREGGAPAWLRLSDVRGVQVRVGSKQALGEELLFEGVGITDLVSDEYRDRRLTWDVVLVTAHGLVPVAHLSQYRVNDWFDFATPIRLAILRKLGWYQEGRVVAARIEEALRAMLRRAGLNVRGGHEATLPTGALDGGLVPPPPFRPPNPAAPPTATATASPSATGPAPIEIPTDSDRTGPAGWPCADGSGPRWPDASGR